MVRTLWEGGWRLPTLAGSLRHLRGGADASCAVSRWVSGSHWAEGGKKDVPGRGLGAELPSEPQSCDWRVGCFGGQGRNVRAP